MSQCVARCSGLQLLRVLQQECSLVIGWERLLGRSSCSDFVFVVEDDDGVLVL